MERKGEAEGGDEGKEGRKDGYVKREGVKEETKEIKRDGRE